MDAENSFTILAVRRRTAFLAPDDRIESWIKPGDFLMAALSSNLGFSMWIFPYKCFKHGGVVFILIYILMQILVGIPILFLDMALGQFPSQGSIMCWSFASLFKGIGIAGVVISIYSLLLHFEILSWIVYYLAVTIGEDELPWTKCRSPWRSPQCRNLVEICRRKFERETDCEPCGYFWNETDGTCRALHDNTTVTAFKTSKAVFTRRDKLSIHDYFNHFIFYDREDHFHEDHEGGMQCNILLGLVFCLVVAGFLLRSNLRWMGRIARYACIVPFAILLILLFKGIGNEGGFDGILVFLKPKLSAVFDKSTWSEAASLTFVSLGLASFNVLNLASYNRFHREIFQDAIIMSGVNTAYSILAGSVVFSFFGHMKNTQGLHKDVFEPESATTLIFSYFPLAVSLVELSRFWSFLYFSSMLILGLAAQVFCMKSIIICFQDCYRWMRDWELAIIIALCVLCFFGGIPMIFTAGAKLFKVFEQTSSNSNVFIIVLFQCIAVAYVYGGNRFIMDIECMIGVESSSRGFPSLLRRWRVVYWLISWYFTCPLIAVILIIDNCVNHSSSAIDQIQNFWVKQFLRLFQVSSAVLISGYMVYIISRTKGSIKRRFSKLTTASPKWGPTKIADQLAVRQRRRRTLTVSLSGSVSEDDTSSDPMPRFRHLERCKIEF